jgi:serine/threonine protein kinase
MFKRREAQGAGLGPGSQLGPYRIESHLGEGGMGQVFRAVRVTDGQTIALKVMKKEFAADEQYSRRFLREARAAQEVHHKHLVRVLEAGEAEGRQYLVMRYVPGRSLEERIAVDGPLGLDELLRMVAHVGAGLDSLHQAGIVHRDIKASNIMLEPDGSASLTDFGLAKGRNYSMLTKPGQVMGTLDYLAPELIRGEEAEARSDIYSFGCVVFECLAGEPPFAGKGVFQVGMAHLEEQPPDPCASRQDTPPGFSEVVLHALAKDPAQRPPTATAYGHLLRMASKGAASR